MENEEEREEKRMESGNFNVDFVERLDFGIGIDSTRSKGIHVFEQFNYATKISLFFFYFITKNLDRFYASRHTGDRVSLQI